MKKIFVLCVSVLFTGCGKKLSNEELTDLMKQGDTFLVHGKYSDAIKAYDQNR